MTLSLHSKIRLELKPVKFINTFQLGQKNDYLMNLSKIKNI